MGANNLAPFNPRTIQELKTKKKHCIVVSVVGMLLSVLQYSSNCCCCVCTVAAAAKKKHKRKSLRGSFHGFTNHQHNQ